VHHPPQTVKANFVTATHDSCDYSSILLPAAVAGINQATNSTPEFHQVAAGYGRYFWHTFVDQTSENYMVEFIVRTMVRNGEALRMTIVRDIRDRIADMVKRKLTLDQVKASKPTLDYDLHYGSTTGFVTTAGFIEAVYKDLSNEKDKRRVQ